MSTLCGADEEKLARNAEKVAERLGKGKPVFQCEKCHRLSHKAENLCHPKSVVVVAAPKVGPEQEASPAGVTEV